MMCHRCWEKDSAPVDTGKPAWGKKVWELGVFLCLGSLQAWYVSGAVWKEGGAILNERGRAQILHAENKWSPHYLGKEGANSITYFLLSPLLAGIWGETESFLHLIAVLGKKAHTWTSFNAKETLTQPLRYEIICVEDFFYFRSKTERNLFPDFYSIVLMRCQNEMIVISLDYLISKDFC